MNVGDKSQSHWILGLAVFLWGILAPMQDAEARRAHLGAHGARSMSRAVNMNARQIFRPTFQIRSRFAAPMTALAVNPAEEWLASGSGNGAVQLWNLKTGQRVLALSGHRGAVRTIAFLSERVAVSETGTRVRTRAAAQRPEYLLTGADDGEAILWNLRSETAIRHFAGHAGGLLLAGADRQGRVVTVAGDGVARFWNVQTGAESGRLDHGLGALTGAALGPGGRRIALGAGREAGIWRLDDGRRERTVALPSGAITALTLTGSEALAIGLDNGRIQISFPGASALSEPLVGHEGAVTALDFGPNARSLVSGGVDHQARLWPVVWPGSQPRSRGVLVAPGGGESGEAERVLAGHHERLNQLVHLAGGRFALSAGDDRMLRLWDLQSGQEALRLVSMRAGWGAVSPAGLFDGTLDGRQEERLDALRWGDDQSSFPVDGFLEQYYRPALFGRLLAGQSIAPVDGAPRVEEGFPLPPRATLVSPASGSEATAGSEVVVEVEELGGGVGEVRLYHNGRLVNPEHARELAAPEENRTRQAFEIHWLPGENDLRAVALSDHRIEGEPAQATVRFGSAGAAQAGALHLFVVGINDYLRDDLTLNFGVPDARGVLDFFRGRNPDPFNDAVLYQLYDAAATRDAIRRVLGGQLTRVAPGDTVLLYLAGHGEVVDDLWYFLPHELARLTEDAIQSQGLSSGEIRNALLRIPGRHVVLMIDACKSGSLGDFFARFDEQRPMALLSRGAGIHIATSTTANQLANELGTLGHGVFTYVLLDGLAGKADLDPADGQIGIREILRHVREEVPELGYELDLDAQEPVVHIRGEDFNLTRPGAH